MMAVVANKKSMEGNMPSPSLISELVRYRFNEAIIQRGNHRQQFSRDNKITFFRQQFLFRFSPAQTIPDSWLLDQQC